jgi:hypothetical protein
VVFCPPRAPNDLNQPSGTTIDNLQKLGSIYISGETLTHCTIKACSGKLYASKHLVSQHTDHHGMKLSKIYSYIQLNERNYLIRIWLSFLILGMLESDDKGTALQPL